MKIVNLEGLVDFVAERAKEILANGEQMYPIFMGQDSEGAGCIVMAPWKDDEERELALGKIRELFASKNIVRYVTASECWVGTKLDIRPSKDAARKECIMIVGLESGGKKIGRFLDIKRLDGNKAELVESGSMKDMSSFGGELTELCSWCPPSITTGGMKAGSKASLH